MDAIESFWLTVMIVIAGLIFAVCLAASYLAYVVFWKEESDA